MVHQIEVYHLMTLYLMNHIQNFAFQNGATVNAEGKLIASQASEPMSLLLLNQV